MTPSPAPPHAFLHFFPFIFPPWTYNLPSFLPSFPAQTNCKTKALRDEIKKCRALTNKPFAVNITLLPVGVPPDYEGIVKVLIEEGVKIVETAGQ